ncbi:hypothetical protein VFPPC_18659 [Pochonia chlamydosporia 170]|uniref:Uncharacterized protein n=1 Tax=Pochonia chlamydosporia 170 TaxID=1380566 RepID=A0A219ATL5_METCM|nr:hypothetical protein VFPPC_18659 [Pochonia chlamydosporia 170]OWT43614.1 hypothetical protein VFPPC_18659 [Pochonia chlamydosporia 170]
MCSRYYRQYRCGHRAYAQPDYCEFATYNNHTKRWSMCPQGRSHTGVPDENLCGEVECYLADLKSRGWSCCNCGETGNRMDGCLGPPGGQMGDCPHYVCTRCSYTSFR